MGSWVSRSPQIGNNGRAMHVTAGKPDFKTINFPQSTQVTMSSFAIFRLRRSLFSKPAEQI